MRHTLSPQLQLGEHDVSTIKFDDLSRDDIPQLLRGLQHLYDDKEDRDAVLELLKENMLETVDADTCPWRIRNCHLKTINQSVLA